jgi:hypothetical protein
MSELELLEKIQDPKFYLEKFCKIKTKEKGLQPFVLNEAQKDLFNALNANKRVIILKARQLGFSTAITGYFYHKTITTPGTNTALIGYNSDLTAELLDKIKTFYRSTPDELKPTLQYNSKYEISFPKIDSKIIVMPSTENVGRGYTFNYVLCTELAFWDKAEEKMASLEATAEKGTLVIESTPNGVANLFHRTFVSERNDYVKKEYGWWWGYNREEIERIKRRVNDPMKFAQEYEMEFLASGRSVFDVNVIKKQRLGILKAGDEYPVGSGRFVQETEGFRVYKQPEVGHIYAAGVDVSEGIAGGDFSVIVIWDRMNGEEVAFYRGLIAPDRLADLCSSWGKKYNNALMAVEVNNHGLVTLTALKNLSYPCLYYRPTKFETIGVSYTDKLGWRTTKVTRPLLIDDLAQGMRDGLLTIHSREMLDEMLTFVYNINNDMVPQDGYHDDTIFAAGIGYQGFKVLYDKPLTQIDEEEHLPTSSSY